MKNIPILDAANAVLTAKEAAGRLGVHLRTLESWARSGRVTRHRIGGRYYYRETDLANAVGCRIAVRKSDVAAVERLRARGFEV